MKFIKKTILSSVLLSTLVGVSLAKVSPASPKSALTVITVTDGGFKGDADQIKGVERALVALANSEKMDVTSVDVDSKDLSKAESAFQGEGKVVVVSSNTYGVEALKGLQANHGGKFIGVLTSHQYVKGFGDVMGHDKSPRLASIIALPKQAVTREIAAEFKGSKTRLVETIGIAHNMLPEDSDKAYKDNHADIPGADDPETKYLLVLLGGDTQNADGKTWAYYTTEEAERLAKFVAAYAKKMNLTVFVTNGPRTGKFDPETKEERKSAHRDGVTDPVTLRFVETLKAEGLPENQYKLFDFQFGKSSDMSRLFGAVRAHGGSEAFIDGGSTSVVSQALGNFSGKNLITIYQHGAMSDIHLNHSQLEYDSGHVALLKRDLKLHPQKKAKGKAVQPAEVVVAKAIMTLVKKPTAH